MPTPTTTTMREQDATTITEIACSILRRDLGGAGLDDISDAVMRAGIAVHPGEAGPEALRLAMDAAAVRVIGIVADARR